MDRKKSHSLQAMRAELFDFFRSIMILFFGIIILQSFSFAGVHSKEGGESSGGGENMSPENGSAWFLGKDKTIETCYIRLDGFGADDQTVRTAIEDTFSNWADYFDKKNIEIDVATKLHIKPKCQGNEDLTYYFGVMPNEVKKRIGKFDHPTAFSVRKTYDLEKGWGKGFVWVNKDFSYDGDAPDWKGSPNCIFSTLLHESGHIFGNKPGSAPDATVMDENHINAVVNQICRKGHDFQHSQPISEGVHGNIHDSAELTHIDLQKILVLGKYEKFFDKKRSGYDSYNLLDKATGSLLISVDFLATFLMGRPILSTIRNESTLTKSLVMQVLDPSGEDSKQKITFEISDDQTNAPQHFDFVVSKISVATNIDNPQFKGVKVIKGKYDIQQSYSPTMGVYQGTIKGSDGRILPATLNFNSYEAGNLPVTVNVFDAKGTQWDPSQHYRTVFVANPELLDTHVRYDK